MERITTFAPSHKSTTSAPANHSWRGFIPQPNPGFMPSRFPQPFKLIINMTDVHTSTSGDSLPLLCLLDPFGPRLLFPKGNSTSTMWPLTIWQEKHLLLRNSRFRLETGWCYKPPNNRLIRSAFWCNMCSLWTVVRAILYLSCHVLPVSFHLHLVSLLCFLDGSSIFSSCRCISNPVSFFLPWYAYTDGHCI